MSAVHYVAFKLTPAQAVSFASGDVPVSLVREHANYTADVALSEDVRESLADDLAEP